MVLKQIELQNFRLHKNTTLNFSDRLNLIVGGNGQGKTTILEAIYYLCTTKNLNLSSESDVVLFGEQNFDVKGKFTDLTTNNTRIYFDLQRNKKSFFLNEKIISNTSEVIGKFPVVTLIQSDHAITLGSPADRRRFVDSVISQASHTYLDILIEYNKILRQRSSLLWRIKETGDKGLFNQLEAWTESLITAGTEIIKQRIRFINEFNDYLVQANSQIIEDKEFPKIIYSTFAEVEEDEAAEKFRQELEENREEELRRAINLVGPHRDEFIFFINDLELKRFGSQGQHKTFQIALRFAQFFFIKDKIGRTPIFLMDDIFGELDSYRANKISEHIAAIGQTFITMTDLTRTEELNLNKGHKLIKVENGTTTYIQ
ncbi:MAG: DNA replication and repair protein RecF [Ignavibacteria bacterium]|nr:MAG: DNA replication and repair protein RecF [Ignavibacteria bacterium]KAF0159088.1 MAG: DNA replication and repair protein RecF [Ignavibacteria bacterium]